MKSTKGIIYHDTNSLTVKCCSFINNKTPKGSYLIYIYYSQLTIDNCYIDNSITDLFNINVESNKSRTFFTNKLIHLSTFHCQAEFVIRDKTIDIDDKLPLIIISLANILNS